ncbi:site-2 protease family protein [Elusimicrobiota bacterium]
MGNIILYKHIFAPFSIVGSLWPLVAVLFFFSVVLHEVAHGYIAYRCGDNTAKAMGRITLNPISHIDPFGTIIVPLLLFFIGGFVVGWAKPVPVNPYNFNDYKMDSIKVSLSGPLTNFSLAVLFSVIVWILNIIQFPATRIGLLITSIFAAGVTVNIILGLFNLIPIPPLDGSRVVSALLPPELSEKYERIAPYGFFILIFMLGMIWPVIIGIGNIFYKMLFMGLPL